MTGPAPKMPVRLVPDALTAMASFFLDSRIWASRRRMSSKSPSASPPGGPDGLADWRMRAAWAAVISSGTPPGRPAGPFGR